MMLMDKRNMDSMHTTSNIMMGPLTRFTLAIILAMLTLTDITGAVATVSRVASSWIAMALYILAGNGLRVPPRFLLVS
jgi:hypothetical protein